MTAHKNLWDALPGQLVLCEQIALVILSPLWVFTFRTNVMPHGKMEQRCLVQSAIEFVSQNTRLFCIVNSNSCFSYPSWSASQHS